MIRVHKAWRIFLFLLLLVSLLLAACGDSDDDEDETPSDEASAAEETADEAPGMSPEAGLAELKGRVFSTGPNSEPPTAGTDIVLTDAELQQIRDMNATAAIVMHYGNNDWSNAQIAGLQAQFEVMGIEVISVTEANFEADKQAENIETVLAEEPDIIVTFPLASAEVFKQAADQGVKLVFMDNLPPGEITLEHGTDYAGIVSADSFANGIASAHLMAAHLDGEGQIGIIFHQADFFVTEQRYRAFRDTITTNYPNIEIVAEQGMPGPDYTADAEAAAAAMLEQYPDLDGIWAPWDVPAEGVMAAAQAAGREDLAITTIDLGLNVAVALAEGNMIVGIGAQRPYDQGVAEAKLAAYALLDKETPEYVVLSALPVTQEDVLRSWQVVYHNEPPEALASAAEAE